MSESRARTIAIEVVVIVGSILLAFTLDAWWDNRQDAARVDALLDVIGGEFRAAEAELDSIIGVNENQLTHLSELLARTDPAHPPIPEDSIPILGRPVGTMQIYNPGFGALDALIRGGDLQLVESLELRSALGGWEARLDDTIWEVNQSFESIERLLESLIQEGLMVEAFTDDPWPARVRAIAGASRARQVEANVGLAYRGYTQDLRGLRDGAREIAEAIEGR